MAKRRAGLPDGDFELNVVKEAPVQMDDYLDRELSPRDRRPSAVAEAPRATPDSTPADGSQPIGDVQAAETRFGEKPPEQSARAKSEPKESRRRRKPGASLPARRPPRMELTLDAESIRKAGDVVSDISEQGPQDDATTTELVKSLVQLAHDVRHLADYSNVNPRGQWGSATAKAYVAEIKESLLKAVGRYYVDRYPEETNERLSNASRRG